VGPRVRLSLSGPMLKAATNTDSRRFGAEELRRARRELWMDKDTAKSARELQGHQPGRGTGRQRRLSGHSHEARVPEIVASPRMKIAREQPRPASM